MAMIKGGLGTETPKSDGNRKSGECEDAWSKYLSRQ